MRLSAPGWAVATHRRVPGSFVRATDLGRPPASRASQVAAQQKPCRGAPRQGWVCMLGLHAYQVGRQHAEPAPPVQNWGRRSRGMQRTGRAREDHASQRGFRRTGPLGSSKPSPPSSGHRLASLVVRLTPTRTFCQAQTQVLCSRQCHNRAAVGGVKGTMMAQAKANASRT